jgi:hypothetical protein
MILLMIGMYIHVKFTIQNIIIFINTQKDIPITENIFTLQES